MRRSVLSLIWGSWTWERRSLYWDGAHISKLDCRNHGLLLLCAWSWFDNSWLCNAVLKYGISTDISAAYVIKYTRWSLYTWRVRHSLIKKCFPCRESLSLAVHNGLTILLVSPTTCVQPNDVQRRVIATVHTASLRQPSHPTSSSQHEHIIYEACVMLYPRQDIALFYSFYGLFITTGNVRSTIQDNSNIWTHLMAC